MSQRPSETILRWFRDTLRERGMNTAALARAAGEKRATVRGVLAGREPLTVDQLVTWGQALELKLEDLHKIQLPEEEPAAEADRGGPTLLRVAEPPPPDRFEVDPYGLQAEQAIKLAFAMGVDFAFVAESAQLGDSGVPQATLDRFQDRLVIKLDAAYHQHNAPTFDGDGVTLTLSFDALYTCTFPWSAIVQVTYFVEPPPPRKAGPEPGEKGRPVLRLVKT